MATGAEVSQDALLNGNPNGSLQAMGACGNPTKTVCMDVTAWWFLHFCPDQFKKLKDIDTLALFWCNRKQVAETQKISRFRHRLAIGELDHIKYHFQVFRFSCFYFFQFFHSNPARGPPGSKFKVSVNDDIEKARLQQLALGHTGWSQT